MPTAQFPDARILLVDDEPANLLLLERALKNAGYNNIASMSDPRQVLPMFEQSETDLILLDLMMPHFSGFDVMEQLKPMIPAGTFLPVLVLTADANPATKRKALAALATDFLTKPFDPVEALLRIHNLLWLRQLHREQARYEQELEGMVRDRTAELRRAMSDLRNTQQQVVQQERMRALGVMAGGVAHDLNNALSVILGFGELVLIDCEHKPELKRDTEAMRAIVTAANDAARMVARLREFNRPKADEVRMPVDLSALIRQAVSLTEPRHQTQARARGVTIDVRMETEKVPPVMGDAAELREALTNLIFNAVDAMPRGGVLTLRARAQGARVILEVSDTGTGMSEEVRQKCLEPFFTTKGENGTGLGLAVVYGIVERHGGTLEIDSREGAGTTFRFSFPAATAETQTRTARHEIAASTARILLVDEQDVFRDILRALLEEDGHSVTPARTGSEALASLGSAGFDLVITNQLLGDMTGSEFIQKLRQRSPAIRVIMLTGFGAEGDGADTSGANLVVSKPIPREGLRHAIATVLAAAP